MEMGGRAVGVHAGANSQGRKHVDEAELALIGTTVNI